MAQAKADGVSLTGEGGLLGQLTKLVLEGALEGELTDHLGRENGERTDDGRSGNYRNGHRSKTVTTEVGPVEIDVPRETRPTGRAGPRRHQETRQHPRRRRLADRRQAGR
ncbi:transposase [Streptomyces abyssomicinicus]|uniref:transposase n=1 Tax=Streptomyces abyssomicinicus TaxID=574929 RepID=UPI003F778020